MKIIVFLSLLVLGFSSVGYSEALFELGKMDYLYAGKFVPTQGSFTNGDVFDGTSDEGMKSGFFRNYEGLFRVDSKGFTVIGDMTPPAEFTKKGDLVVSGDIYVKGGIFNEASFELQSACINKQDLKDLKAEIRLLKQKVTALENK